MLNPKDYVSSIVSAKYLCLFVLTAGIIDDYHEVIKMIKELRFAPVSIFIIKIYNQNIQYQDLDSEKIIPELAQV